MPMKVERLKVSLSGHFKWLSQCQDWFTKSGCPLKILKLKTWNFAWDLILPIHMLYKKSGSIWELFEKLAQPSRYTREIRRESKSNTFGIVFTEKNCNWIYYNVFLLNHSLLSLKNELPLQITCSNCKLNNHFKDREKWHGSI